MNIAMKVVMILTTLLCPSIFARPKTPPSSTAVIKVNDYVLQDNGEFSFNVETSDGFHHDAVGELIPVTNTDQVELVVRGSYSYIGPDGKRYTVEYVADSNGFQPVGEHLPGFVRKPEIPQVAPPIVEDISSLSSGCIASLCGSNIG